MQPGARDRRQVLAERLKSLALEHARRRAAPPMSAVPRLLDEPPEFDDPDTTDPDSGFDPLTGPPPRAGQSMRARLYPRSLRSGLLLGLVLVAVGLGLVAGASPKPPASPSPSAVASPASPTPSGVPSAAAFVPPPNPDRLVFLVVGIDDMHAVGRSDTILVVDVMLDRKKIHILSVPRDSFARIARKGGVVLDKVNHAFMWGGIDLSRPSIEGLLGVRIDHYCVVDYDIFLKVIEAMGGIPIKVDKRMYYVDKAAGLKVDLHPGDQVLGPSDALAYVRFRHDAEGDLGRIKRQQKFVKAVLGRLKDPKVIAYLAYKLPSFLASVTTDVSAPAAAGLMWKARDIAPGDVEVAQVPGDGGLMMSELHHMKLWYFIVDQEKLVRILKEWFYNPDSPGPPQFEPAVGHGKSSHNGRSAAASTVPSGAAGATALPEAWAPSGKPGAAGMSPGAQVPASAGAGGPAAAGGHNGGRSVGHSKSTTATARSGLHGKGKKHSRHVHASPSPAGSPAPAQTAQGTAESPAPGVPAPASPAAAATGTGQGDEEASGEPGAPAPPGAMGGREGASGEEEDEVDDSPPPEAFAPPLGPASGQASGSSPASGVPPASAPSGGPIVPPAPASAPAQEPESSAAPTVVPAPDAAPGPMDPSDVNVGPAEVAPAVPQPAGSAAPAGPVASPLPSGP